MSKKSTKKAAKKPAKAAKSAKSAKSAKKPAPKKAAKKPAPKKAAPKKAAPKKVAAKKAAPPVSSLHTQRKAALEAKAVPDLKAMLHKNDQIVTGSKSELVERALDRIENGNLPRCPKCGLGRLRLNSAGDGYTCPGGFDDDEYRACSYTGTLVELPRPAWQFEAPGSPI